MDGADRLQELAEMIGGQRITDTTRAQAQELLDAATGEFTADRGVQPEEEKPAGKIGKNGRKVRASQV